MLKEERLHHEKMSVLYFQTADFPVISGFCNERGIRCSMAKDLGEAESSNLRDLHHVGASENCVIWFYSGIEMARYIGPISEPVMASLYADVACGDLGRNCAED